MNKYAVSIGRKTVTILADFYKVEEDGVLHFYMWIDQKGGTVREQSGSFPNRNWDYVKLIGDT